MAFISPTYFEKTWFIIIFVMVCCVENFLVAGPIYGYSSILVIFKRMKFYHHLCENGTEIDDFKESSICNAQAQALNWIYIFGILTHSITKFPIGYCVDRFGSQFCQYVGCMCMLVFGLMLGRATPGQEFIIYIAFLFLSLASSLLMLSVYQAVNVLCKSGKAMCICMISGAVDCSSAVFLLFLTGFEAGQTLLSVTISYATGTVIFIILITCFFFPSKLDIISIVEKDVKEQLRKGLKEDGVIAVTQDMTCSYKGGSTSTFNMYKDSLKRNVMEMSTEELNSCMSSFSQSAEFSHSFQLSINYKHHEEILTCSNNYTQRYNEFGADSKNPFGFRYNKLIEEKAPLVLTSLDKDETLLGCICTWLNFFAVLLCSIVLLKLLYFVGNLDKYLLNITDENTALLNIKTFGYIQFMGVVLAPISGFLFHKSENSDTKVSLEEQKIQRLRGSIIPAIAMIAATLLLDGMQLLRIIDLSIPIFILYLFSNSMLFCFASIFSATAFPPKYFCSMYGFTVFVCGIVSLLQFPMLTMEQDLFYGNQFWVNLIFFGICLLPLSFPTYIWFYCWKEEARMKIKEKPQEMSKQQPTWP